MNEKRFTPRGENVLRLAQEAAGDLGHGYVGCEHILLGILRDGGGAACRALNEAGVSEGAATEQLVRLLGRGISGADPEQGLTPRARGAVELATGEALRMGSRQVGAEHLLLGLLRDGGNMAVRILALLGVDARRLYGDVRRQLGEASRAAEQGTGKAAERVKGLADFARDLTAMAREGRLDPMIGRETELRRMIQILTRRTKNNPVLIGEPGVGKTAVVEGLAQRIAASAVPAELQGKRVLSLDLAGMVAGTKYRGEFEERVRGVIGEVVRDGGVLLFIDELHTVVGAGSAEGAIDAANIIKPALGRAELRVIGATTLAEYRRYIEKDAALERRFQPILVGEPTAEESARILRGLRSRYEAHHGLRITDAAIDAAVALSRRYIGDRFLPDKAIDLMDEAASHARMDARESGCVTQEDVASVVALWTGVPVAHVTEDESARLLRLEETLRGRVVGQDEAVRAVARAIRRSRVGIRDPGRPVGSFLFLGPTGVGKTELCRALAEALFGDESAMIRIDMSEYMEAHAVSRLIGAPPGYVGYDEGGQLTEAVRRKPYSVVLLDELEKAHEDVWNLLLQVLDDGILTDAQGRRADFRNAVVIMTSNVGAADASHGALGFARGGTEEDAGREREAVTAALRRTFKPEFLNRVDETVIFRRLTEEDIAEIARRMLARTERRVAELGVRLDADEQAVRKLARAGFDPLYGARPLRRVIQSQIEDAVAERLLEGRLKSGDRARVTVADDKLCLA